MSTRLFEAKWSLSELDLTKNTLRSEGREVQIKQRSEGLGLQHVSKTGTRYRVAMLTSR
jgi:hypothetical protein